MEKHGLLDVSHAFDVRSQDSVETGARLTAYLLDQDPAPSAIIAASDTFAIGAWHGISHRGLRPGPDVAIVGFDDSPTARVLDLSSVHQPIELAGRIAMHALLTQFGHRRRQMPEPVDETPGKLLTPTLVVRASSAAHAK
jgi:LacI family transcriptional regulator